MSDSYLDLAGIQKRGFGMLKYVDAICKKEGLTYWLSGGTLLGAIRHEGFIPWDDDVDLMMPRPDFERLLAAVPRYADERYSFVHPRIDRASATPWIRVYDRKTEVDLTNMVKEGACMLFADIFPVDALPANPMLCRLHFRRVRLRDILLKCSRKMDLWGYERLKALKRVLMVLTSVFPPNTYARWLDSFCRRGNYAKAGCRGVCVVTHYKDRERMPAEVFDGTAEVTFCGERFPAPAGWERYLRGLYGDYMQLPPPEKRFSDHRIKARVIGE